MYRPSESPAEEGESWSRTESESEEEEEDIWPAEMGEEEEEEGVWPPVWKPVEKSPQYELIDEYLKFGEDRHAHVYPPGVEEYDVIKRFIQQVRESREHMMECEFLSGEVEKNIKFVIQKINARAEMHGEKYVLDKPVKVVSVTVRRTFCLTFTVKEVRPNPNDDVVKTVQAMVFFKGPYDGYQLLEWRFKPQEDEGTTTSTITS